MTAVSSIACCCCILQWGVQCTAASLNLSVGKKRGVGQVTGDKEECKQRKIQSHHGQLLWLGPETLPGSGLQCDQEGGAGKRGAVLRRQVQVAADAKGP